MGEAALTYLLESLGKLWKEQFHLISSAKSELELLQYELNTMKAYLKDAASRREKGYELRVIEQRIRDVVYEAEDTIDACIYQNTMEKSKTFILRHLNPKRFSLAEKVQQLNIKVKKTFEKAKQDILIIRQSVTDPDETRDNRTEIPSVREDNVVGFDKHADNLITYLKEETKELGVISITGMPGLGKTTLAWKIYNDPRVELEFPTRIWVYVSHEFNKKGVFLTILKKFTQEDMSGKTDNELAILVRFHLENLKFILFMDDVWTPEAWKDIEAALPMGDSSGKVLLTSRQNIVAVRANRIREPYVLHVLDFAKSWELLQLEVFGKLDACPPELDMHGKNIAIKCGGVPLAIVVIGGILVKTLGDRQREDEWKKVSWRVSEFYSKDTKDAENRTKEIIELSYNELSSELRDCFIYLAMFPEDTSIDVWKLIRLWIAEGFIQETLGMSLEEVAGDDLKNLIKRNLVMVDKTKVEGDVKTCHMHDMIREFCKNKAAEQNLFQEMKKSSGVFYPSVSEIKDHRRLCIHSYILDFLKKKPKGTRVRSFLCFSKEAITLPLKNILSVQRAFNLLRVLDVNPIKFPKFPDLTKLIYLKYIALSVDESKDLPESVSKLCNLQTIRIDTGSRTFKIKANILDMGQLRHLKTKAAITFDMKVISHMKRAKKAAEDLQSLSRLSTECCTVDFFIVVPNLMNLGIRGQLDDTLLDSSCFEKLRRLQKLKIVYDAYPKVQSENPLPRLPQPEKFPPDLRILELSATHLKWTHMSVLGKLGSLKVLKLKKNAFVGESWNADDVGSFKFLEFLLIAHIDLMLWTASKDQFPKLSCLVLKNCEKLQNIPLFEENKYVQILTEGVSESAVASAKTIQENKQKTQERQSAEASCSSSFSPTP